jgi:hypothetical protein
MDPRKHLTNGNQKSSEKIDNKVNPPAANPLKIVLKTFKLVPQWFKDRPKLLPHLKYQYARSSNRKLFLMFKSDASHYARDFLRATIRGDEATVLRKLRKNPALLLERGHFEKGITTDYAGRKYSGLTAFQIALCTGDEIMAMKMMDIFIAAYPETGKAELDKQFDAIFPFETANGYEAHLAAQRASADQFMQDVIEPLIKVFNGIDPRTGEMNEHIIEDLNAALEKRDNGSALCQALNQFRKIFTELSQGENVFNPWHLLKAFEKYSAMFNGWYGDGTDPNRWLRLDLFWRQVIGFMQRFLPANFAQVFCTGFYNLNNNRGSLTRSLKLFNFVSNRHIDLFPLDADLTCRLGFDFAVYSTAGCEGRLSAPGSIAPIYARLLCESKWFSDFAATIAQQRSVSLLTEM